jgi:hypothetical protein
MATSGMKPRVTGGRLAPPAARCGAPLEMAKLPNPQLANEQARQAPVRFGSLHTLPQGMTLTILGHNASSSLSDASLGGSDLHPLLPAPGTAAPHDDCLRICPRERHTEDVGFCARLRHVPASAPLPPAERGDWPSRASGLEAPGGRRARRSRCGSPSWRISTSARRRRGRPTVARLP